MPRKIGVLAWLIVVLVGALVLGLVYGLRLYPRLNAGQRAVDGLKPAFTPERIQGDRAGINYLSHAVDLLDPITTSKGTAGTDFGKLVTYVSQNSNLTPAQITAALQQFPKTVALLHAIPLSDVTSELPAFETFVAAALKVTPDQLVATLKSDFPHLYQIVVNLPKVTSGWDNVPGVAGLTRFDGTAVKTAPQVRDYFNSDAIPVLEGNQTNFRRVATYYPPVKYIPPLLTAIGAIAVLFGLLMMLRAAASAKVGRKEGTATWTVVLLLGLVVLGIVFGAQIYPRLDGGSHLLRDARPVYTPQRVSGGRAGIDYVATVVTTADQIMYPDSGAPAEVGKLLTVVEGATHDSPAQLVAALGSKFPHTTALLQALPLSGVSGELPGVIGLLHIVLNQPTDQVVALLKAKAPGLAQSIVSLPLVVSGWNSYPGGAGLTRFDGTQVKTAPQLATYFSDLVGAVQKTTPDFRKLDGIKPDLTLFPGLLTILGGLVVVYGIIMLIMVNLPDPEAEMVARKERGPGGRRAAGATAL